MSKNSDCEIYNLPAETFYMKDGVQVPLKSPKLDVNAKTIKKDVQYCFTVLKPVETRHVVSSKDGKQYDFRSVFAKITGTEDTVSLQLSEVAAKALEQYEVGAELVITKDYYESKTGALMPTVKVECKNGKIKPQEKKQVTIGDFDRKNPVAMLNEKEKAALDEVYPVKPITQDENIVFAEFMLNEKNYTEDNFVKYYLSMCDNPTDDDTIRAKEVWKILFHVGGK